jgi:hypothetical protein
MSHQITAHHDVSYQITARKNVSYRGVPYQNTTLKITAYHDVLYENTTHEITAYHDVLYENTTHEITAHRDVPCQNTTHEITARKNTAHDIAAYHHDVSYQITTLKNTASYVMSHDDDGPPVDHRRSAADRSRAPGGLRMRISRRESRDGNDQARMGLRSISSAPSVAFKVFQPFLVSALDVLQLFKMLQPFLLSVLDVLQPLPQIGRCYSCNDGASHGNDVPRHAGPDRDAQEQGRGPCERPRTAKP